MFFKPRNRHLDATDQTNRPDIFIVGTMKGGTTILHEFLTLHPEVYAGSEKEIHYFSLHEDEGLDWYHNHFKHLPLDKRYIDASPTYFDMAASPSIPKKIHAYNPNARVIMLARDPIDRAISHFNHFRKVNNFEQVMKITPDEFFSRSIEDSIGGTTAMDLFFSQSLNFSCYFRKAINYKNIFGDNFLAVDNAALAENPQETMDKVFRHLRLDPIRSKKFHQWKYSHGSGARSSLSQPTLDRLEAILKENYRLFCDVTGIQFRWQ